MASHEAEGEKKTKQGPRTQRKTQDAPGRVTQACKACASNHLRCTESKPCRRCQNKGIDCVWNLTGVVSPEPPTEGDHCTLGQPPQTPSENFEMETSDTMNETSVRVSSPSPQLPWVEQQPENQQPDNDGAVAPATPLPPPYQQPFLGKAILIPDYE